jgi:hypothetical protein
LTGERMHVAARAYAYYAEPVDRQVRIDYLTRPAHRFASVTAEESPDAVSIAIVVTSPRGPTRATGHQHSITADLAAPLGTRRVVDSRTGLALARLPSASGNPSASAGRSVDLTDGRQPG